LSFVAYYFDKLVSMIFKPFFLTQKKRYKNQFIEHFIVLFTSRADHAILY